MSTASTFAAPQSSGPFKIPTDVVDGHTFTPRTTNGERASASEEAAKRVNGQAGTALLPDEPIQRQSRVPSGNYGGMLDRHRTGQASRRSGGFLLEPFSLVSKRKRTSKDPLANQSRRIKQEPDDVESRSGDGSMSGRQSSSTFSREGLHLGNEARHSPVNGYGSNIMNRDVKGKTRASLQIGDEDAGSSNSMRTTPTMDSSQYVGQKRPTLNMPVMDPTMIVQMALSLNESRKMNLGPGYLASTMMANDRRTVSAGVGPPSPDLQAVNKYGGSLRATRHQPSNSKNPSSQRMPNFNAPRVSHESPSSTPSRIEEHRAEQSFDTDYGQQISPLTWARADKAKAFFELSHQYRRLLQSLPPLKPIALAAMEQDIGRPYNPLQYIRNRRIRSHEDQAIDAEAAGWHNVELVKIWVENVEVDAQETDTRSGDAVKLPPWVHRNRAISIQAAPPTSPTLASSAGASSPKPKWTKLDWSITPPSLLADAHWLEQGRNKTLIESRNGSKVYTRFQAPQHSRISEEYERKSLDALSRMQTQHMSSPESAHDSALPTSPRVSKSDERARFRSSVVSVSPRESRATRMKRHLLGRHKHERDPSPGSDTSNHESSHAANLRRKGSLQYDNTGPLERHMNKMLEAESRTLPNDHSQKEVPAGKRDSQARRGGVSAEHQDEVVDDSSLEFQAHDDFGSARNSFEFNHLATPRISIEDADAPDELGQSFSRTSTGPLSEHDDKDDVPKRKHHASRMNFFRKSGKVKEENGIAETDFAMLGENTQRKSGERVRSSESPRSSMEELPRSSSYKSLRIVQPREVRSKSQDDPDHHSGKSRPGSTGTRFFKGGRIGEIVRSERPRVGGFVWKKRAPRDRSSGSSKQDASSDSDDEETEHQLMLSARDHRRSRSTNDLQHSKYHVKNLPAFRSAHAREAGNDSLDSDDHISRQSRAMFARKGNNRLGRLAPLTINTTDVSPGSSTLNLSRFTTGTPKSRSSKSNDRDRSPGDTRSSSRSRSAVRHADQRLNAILREPGGVGKGGPGITGLARLEARRRSQSKGQAGHRSWSIADGAFTAEEDVHGVVTSKEIAYVRALLLASGVKATTLVRRAHAVRDPPAAFLLRAATTSNASLQPVKRKEEHVLAARMLSQSLEEIVSSCEEAAEQFRGVTCAQLYRRIDDLREKVGSKLTPLVRSCGDEADGFIAELTTTHMLAIKQVNDSVDLMLRNRRRRLRWLRQAGFAMLEWVLVGLMWLIWLLVWVLKLVKTVVVGTVRGVRWLI